MSMSRTWVVDALQNVESTTTVRGWVNARREHGKVIFIDLRDRTGLLQAVFLQSKDRQLFSEALEIRTEYVLKITGKIQKRSKKQVNSDILTGTVELVVDNCEILNKALTPIFEIDKAAETSEETRMRYRYLDIRSQRMKENLEQRHRVVKLVRDELDNQAFLEIETPYLTKGTPEGAREFVVPARLSPGNFFVLPQSPQQFKQLLMVGGVDRYFQIARCFRDEDTRGDRQAEFTQMDLEMSFVNSEEVMKLNEDLLIKIVKVLYPNKIIQEIPFPRIPYSKSMSDFGTDRPDIRNDKTNPNLLAFCWVIDFPMFEKNGDVKKSKSENQWTFTHNPFSSVIPDHRDWLLEKKNIGKIISDQYDIVLNGYEIGGGSIRNHRAGDLKAVLEVIGLPEEEIESNFGHILEALEFGAPPHGGIAWGLERLLMILQNEKSIRDVMAFPKTGDNKDLMMGAPSLLSKRALVEAGLTK